MKQTQFQPQAWTPTRGERKNASEQLVADALTALGIEWAYEDRFLPLEAQGQVVRGFCPDYRIMATRQWPEQYLEVTTAKQLSEKRRKARRAERAHATKITVVDNQHLSKIQRNPWHILTLLQTGFSTK